jgi:hypothetical protein
MYIHKIQTTSAACTYSQHTTVFPLMLPTGTMPSYTIAHKVTAALSFRKFNGSTPAAVKDFTNSCETLGLNVPLAPKKYLEAYGPGWDPNTTCKGRRGKCGRKRKISQENAELLVADLMNWAGFNLKGPFKSLKQLKKLSGRAKGILEAAKAADSTVIAALKRVEPKLAYKKLTVKQRLTKKQRAARLRVAQHHLTVDNKDLEVVVWVDAKTMYMTIKTRCGWVRVDDELPFETTRPGSKKKPITLRYYIGVCAKAGAVFMEFYTGTTGMAANRDPQHVYLVSSCHVQLALAPLLGLLQCLIDCCTPASGTACCLIRKQPDHLISLLHSCIC